MKDYIKEIVNKQFSANENTNTIREYLQKYLLYILYKKKIYLDIVFAEGTSLRFLYKMKRFSEDLDFSLSYNPARYDFKAILETTKNEFILSGYELEIKYIMDKNVHSAFFKFPGLLFEYELSPYKDEKISIKMEIDTNPPQGGKTEITLYNSVFMFYIMHYDIQSLFAGKLHALLCRKYTKGRDWYDLLWYLTNFKDIEPNFTMLNNAIRQTGKDDYIITKQNWKIKMKERVMNADIEKIKNDVYKFLEDPGESSLLTKENLCKLL